jgi:uncharacterized protein (DUF1697 family)
MMTKYVALLRGINVGGKNIIKMNALQKAVEACGYKNVLTFIQSGNVMFDAQEKNIQNVTVTLEKALSKVFNYQSKIVVISHDQLKQVLSQVPSEWKTKNDVRCYIAFIKEPVTAQEVREQTKPKEGIDTAKTGNGVLYMSTLLSGITKSGFTKLIGTKVYKDITIRNYTTVQKICAMMG